MASEGFPVVPARPQGEGLVWLSSFAEDAVGQNYLHYQEFNAQHNSTSNVLCTDTLMFRKVTPS